MTDWTSRFAARGQALKPSAIRATAKFAEQPGAISFASGSPNPSLFPYDAITQAMTAIMADPRRRGEALQYGASEGYRPLREFIERYLRDAGAQVALDMITVTNGSQQALEFLAKLFVEPGDRIVVTNPTYLGALQAFGLFEPVYACVPTHQAGIDLEALEREFSQGAKFMYLMPDFGNPSGITLSLEERLKVLELSRRHKVLIVEDQAYEQLRFAPKALPSMPALDTSHPAGSSGRSTVNVIHAGTFSKSLVPGLRVGWVVAPPAVTQKLVSIKQASDLHGGQLNQMIVHDVATAILRDHTERLRGAYRRRRDLMLRALARHMPQEVAWNEPGGGMFVWLSLPAPLDAAELQMRAIRDENVVFVPGAPFFADSSGKATLRLSFSSVAEDAIAPGIERLARAVRAAMAAEGEAAPVAAARARSP
jgi:DNA-binding transcriptional MocR family regulator